MCVCAWDARGQSRDTLTDERLPPQPLHKPEAGAVSVVVSDDADLEEAIPDGVITYEQMSERLEELASQGRALLVKSPTTPRVPHAK